MLKAVIFDMDGVLIDSEPVHYRANKELLQSLGCEIEYEYYKQFIGSTNTYMLTKIIKDFSLDKSIDWLSAEAEKICNRIVKEEGMPRVAGAAELVRSLYKNGYLLAVASSSPLYKIERTVKSLGIEECFTKLVSGENVKNPKPAPDVFLEAAKQLGVEPDKCLVVEDSDNGSLAAKRAGMVCLGYLNENSGEQKLDKADYLTESLEAMDADYLNMIYCHTVGEPYIVAQTERLIIRETTLEDLDRLYEIYSEPSITEYTENLYEDREREEEFTRSYIENMYKFYEYGVWSVCLKDGYLIGRAGICHRKIDSRLELELGYIIDKKYQRQGYATEALKAIIAYAKERLDVKQLNAFIQTGNTASIELIKSFGFEYVLEQKIAGKMHEMYRKRL